MNLILLITYIIFFSTEIILNALLRSKEGDKKNADKKSLTLLWLTIMVAATAAGFISGTIPMTVSSNSEFKYAGVVIIYIGIIFRLSVIYSMGHFFTVDVTIRQNHKVKTNGAFKYIRHPSYAASLLSFIGLGFTFNNWLSLFVIIIPVFIAFLIRINIEEKVLIQHFGSEYSEYKKRTKKLIPFIY